MDVEMLAIEVELAVFGLPHAEDDLQGLPRALCHGRRISGVNAEQRQVGSQGAYADAPVEAAPG